MKVHPVQISTIKHREHWYAWAHETGKSWVAVVDARASSEELAIVRCVAALQKTRPGSEYSVIGSES